jgi:hypothetical protein
MKTWFRILCVAGLVGLIMSPVTAPFSTCSLAELLNSGADRDGVLLVLPQVTAADDDVKIGVQAMSIVVFRLAVIGVGRLLPLTTPVRLPQVPSTVIRV